MPGEELRELANRAVAEIAGAADDAALEAARVKYLGRKEGALSEALNIPPGHPAREKWQTLWISNPLGDDPSRPLLGRTHTSPMQIRVMEQRKPPIRVVIPGRCYRYEATDAIRESIFFQYEGLAID